MEMSIILKLYRIRPILALLWNRFILTEEYVQFEVIPIIKKKIL